MGGSVTFKLSLSYQPPAVANADDQSMPPPDPSSTDMNNGEFTESSIPSSEVMASISESTIASWRSAIVAFRPYEKLMEDGVVREHVEPFIAFLDERLSSGNLGRYEQQHAQELMKLVAIRHRILPSSFFVTDIERKGENPIAGGGFADVYRGKWHGQEVCLKVLRVYLGAEGHNKDSAVSDFFKEAIVWQRLNHPNIMPFLGVDKTCFPGRLAFVSPFMENLDVMTFLRANPSHNRIDCLAQIASGLKYLHASSIVHGDIKGANVLVDSDCQCRLADFGISAVVELNGATLNASTGSIKGSLRWMPPEFIFPEADVKRSSRWDKFYNGDIYSFACTMIEIITGMPPFGNDTTDYQVMLLVTSGERPPRPEGLSDDLWTLIEMCWRKIPCQRPEIHDVSHALSSSIWVNFFPDYEPIEDEWDESILREYWPPKIKIPSLIKKRDKV